MLPSPPPPSRLLLAAPTVSRLGQSPLDRAEISIHSLRTKVEMEMPSRLTILVTRGQLTHRKTVNINTGTAVGEGGSINRQFVSY